MKNSILIIDDSTFAIKVLNDILQEDYAIFSAKNGEEGILAAEEVSPSLILLDIEMPGMNGFEVLKVLKEKKSTCQIPVIFLTSMIAPEYEEKGFLCGAVDYIVKPYNSNIVKVRVKSQVELSEYKKKMEEQLMYDTLVNIFNRRGLEHYFLIELERAARRRLPITFMLFDLDYFKLINDTYGHLEGDYTLQKLGEILKQCIPEGKGFAARYGGEEFAIVLPEMEKEESIKIMEYVFQKLKERKINNENSPVSPYLTVSAGCVTLIPDESVTIEKVIAIADKMLYKSKETGRNRYCWYEASV